MANLFLILSLTVFAKQDLQKCVQQIQKISSSIIQVLENQQDRYGKMLSYSGIMLNDLGNYEKCKHLDQAKYVVFPVNKLPLTVIAVCFPQSCFTDSYKQTLSLPLLPDTAFPILKNQLQAFPVLEGIAPQKFWDEFCKDLDVGAQAMIAFTSILAFIVLVATLIQFYTQELQPALQEQQNTRNYNKLKTINETTEDTQNNTRMEGRQRPLLMRIILGFSAISNFKKIFESPSVEKLGQKDTLDVLNAVRVFSIGQVVVGHTAYVSIKIVLGNFQSFSHFVKQPFLILQFTANFAVDTFFWLSGLLMTYLFLKNLRGGKLNSFYAWAMVYIHRYLRITPLFMFCTFFFWALQMHLGDGPMWWLGWHINKDCPDWWWTNMLYLNNFIPNGHGSGCLGVSWYLANDMQFFIIGTICLFFYHRFHRVIGWLLVLVMLIVSIVTTWGITYHYDIKVSILAESNGNDRFDYYYQKPYCRIGAYALGIAAGMILHTYKEFKATGYIYDPISYHFIRIFENVFWRYVGFFYGLVLVNFFMFFQQDTYGHPDGGEYNRWGHEGNEAFMAFYRIGFVLGVFLIVMPMLFGHFTWLAAFMSHQVFRPLARISFALYLIHINIIAATYTSQQSSMHFGVLELARDGLFFFLFASAIAVLFVLVVEFPAMNLERNLLGGRSSSNKKQVN